MFPTTRPPCEIAASAAALSLALSPLPPPSMLLWLTGRLVGHGLCKRRTPRKIFSFPDPPAPPRLDCPLARLLYPPAPPLEAIPRPRLGGEVPWWRPHKPAGLTALQCFGAGVWVPFPHGFVYPKAVRTPQPSLPWPCLQGWGSLPRPLVKSIVAFLPKRLSDALQGEPCDL